MKVQVRERDVLVTEEETLVSGSEEEYIVEFDFIEAWAGYSKEAVFQTQNGLTKELVIIEDRAVIPWEVLTEPQYIILGVYGIKGTQKRPTVWSRHIYVRQGTTQGDPVISPETTPWQQALSQMGEYLADAQAAKEEAEQAAQNVPPGQDALIISQATEYQISQSGTEPPLGSWSSEMPQTPQGAYLWTRNRILWNTGQETIMYLASKTPEDGIPTVTVNVEDETLELRFFGTEEGGFILDAGTSEGA